MFPTVTDQLRELRRVLADVVMPEVTGSYATDTLSSALATLKMLERAWDRVVPFLVWDNEQLIGLLGDAGAADRPDSSDFGAVHERNLALRERLATTVRDFPDEVATDALTAYFRQRIARYPFSSTASLPTRK